MVSNSFKATVFLNGGNGSYAVDGHYGEGYVSNAIQCADLDDDCDLDIAYANAGIRNRSRVAPLSRRDRHLEYAVPLVRKKIVGFFNLIQGEPMGDEGPKVRAPGSKNIHQAAHALLAARA